MNNVKANKSAHKESIRGLRYKIMLKAGYMILVSLFLYLGPRFHFSFMPKLCFYIILQFSFEKNPLLTVFYNLVTSFCRTDLKFCSCSDDTTVKVWDFARCQEERSLSGNVLDLFE